MTRPRAPGSAEGNSAAHGRSLEQELRLLVTEAAQPTRDEVVRTAASIRSLSQKSLGIDLDALLREGRKR